MKQLFTLITERS